MAEELRKTEGRIVHTFENVSALINGGLTRTPLADHIDAEFEVKSVNEKANGTWIWMFVKGETEVAYTFNAAELVALEDSCIVKLDDETMGIDEQLLMTWTKDNPKLVFRTKA